MKKLLAILVLLLIPSFSSGEVIRVKYNPGLVLIRLEEKSVMIADKPLDLEYELLDLADGKQVAVFCSGKNKEIIVTAFSNGEIVPNVKRYIIEIEGVEPTPDPVDPVDPIDPDVPPNPPDVTPSSELGKFIQSEGRRVGLDKEVAKEIAGNYEAIASKLAAVSSFTVVQAKNELIALNRETTRTRVFPLAGKTIEEAINKYLEENAGQDKKKVQDAFNLVAEGFKSV